MERYIDRGAKFRTGREASEYIHRNTVLQYTIDVERGYNACFPSLEGMRDVSILSL